MNLDIHKLQERLCSLMCAEVSVIAKGEGLLSVETPFFFADGDPYQIYIREMPGGIMRLTDMGHTMMHLSYENDTDKFREGTRGRIFDQILSEMLVHEDNGEFYIDTPAENLGTSIFKLGQALTKINDLTFLNRSRAESTFYEDLHEKLFRIVDVELIRKDYNYEGTENSQE